MGVGGVALQGNTEKAPTSVQAQSHKLGQGNTVTNCASVQPKDSLFH